MTDIIGYYGKREGNGPLAEKLVGHRDTTNSSEQTAKLQQHTEAAINSMHEADLKAGKLRLTLEDFEAHAGMVIRLASRQAENAAGQIEPGDDKLTSLAYFCHLHWRVSMIKQKLLESRDYN